MDRNLNRLIEQQIAKARAEGKLTGLEGEGKPLPEHPENRFVEPGEAVGFRVMAEAGALPEEITLKKALAAAKADYAEAPEDRKKQAMSRIADLELQLAIAQEARRKFLG